MSVNIARTKFVSKRFGYNKLVGADGVKCEMWFRTINGKSFEFQRIERPTSVAFFVGYAGKFIHKLRFEKPGG